MLVTRDLVERIGLPRAEFFIWGDDHEYRLRAERGRRPRSPPSSTRACGTRRSATSARRWCSGGRRTTTRPSDLKHYCMARNNLVNLREYGGSPARRWRSSPRRCGSTRSPGRDPGRIRLSVEAWRAALRGDFTGHRRFL